MEWREHGRGLIRTRLHAEVIVLATAFVAALSIRRAFSHAPYNTEWGFPLSSMLPEWGGVTVYLAFYAYLLWLCVAFFWEAQGKERVVVGCYFIPILLSPLQHVVSPAAADAIQYFKAGNLLAAFVAAMLVLVQLLARDKVQSGQ
jgi:hypothetical protein